MIADSSVSLVFRIVWCFLAPARVFPSLYFDGSRFAAGRCLGPLTRRALTAGLSVSVLQHSIIPRGSLSLKVLAELPIIVVLMYQVLQLLSGGSGWGLLDDKAYI